MKETDVIDEYIQQFQGEVRDKLIEMKSIIFEVLPMSELVIRYKMPAFKVNSVLVYFAGYKNHIGFYPTATGIEAFKEEFGDYKWSKGAIQFPLNQPLPKKLIQKISLFKLNEDLIKSTVKKKSK
jgi:uncharacterized protein YdhG (YjbR/CyaY superfamily)